LKRARVKPGVAARAPGVGSPHGRFPASGLRASDADRERVAELLRHAAGDGQLTLDELNERLDAAYRARTHADLVPLTADLQEPGSVPAVTGSRSAGISVRPGAGGARWLIAVMSGLERKGRWRLAERAVSLNLMGGSELDLNQVELGSDHVELTVISIMGGSEIRVPNGLRVEVSEFALMGGNSVRIEEDRPSTSGPVLLLRLFSLMGGVDVKRGPKLSRAERKALKQERRGHFGH
jgi:hypothetical protein